MTHSFDAGDVNVLQSGQMKSFRFGRRTFLLARSADGRYHALANLCAHQGVDLGAGVLTGHWLPSRPGEYIYVDDAEVLRCPRHGYEYDVNSGRSWFAPETVRIKVYDVSIRTGRVIVELPAG